MLNHQLDSSLVVDDQHSIIALVEITSHAGLKFEACKLTFLLVYAFFDAEEVGAGGYEVAHVAVGAFAGEKVGAVVAEVVLLQAFHLLTFGSGVAIDDALVALVGDITADIVLVVGHQDALPLAPILLIQLHDGMKSSAAAGKEVENGRGFRWTLFDN